MKFVKLSLDGFESRMLPAPIAPMTETHCVDHVHIVGTLQNDASTNTLILVVIPPHGPARRYKLVFANHQALQHAEKLVGHTVLITGVLGADNETIFHAHARKHR